MNHATAPSPPRRLRADAARNQQRIVAAARELFADHGLEITLDDVAERAGVGVGTVYRRFANKTELIAEVFEQHLGDLLVAAQEAARHEDPWLGLVEFFEYACGHLAANRGFGEVMLELQQDPERFVALRDRIKPAVAEVIDRAREAGALQPDIESSDFFAMIHMLDALTEFTNPVNPGTWRRYVAVMLNGVRSDSVPRMPLTVPPLTDDEVERAKAHACASHRRR
ncbi:TetR/AcrR family transcriptional regulator [Nocardia puris]|uniref:TetR family transcriptional regulator n=1 Tax=Nocardia puris TaxID=208602 RepID=A0A366D0Q9_9NOCA|nr:TetR/AcrR family transcriptional regulator [Nocardia puris]MBF6215142.1 TetR/AcrR family transcriptional regulator [Nocardia puris]MBF6369653.1 TetR/AcrR family transcriptional regulator [Nocardia puris]MBF6462529.1 TetR/AcrR family transcriptional regulator [Nocardia puris]RBO83621.1 TetR family transcriptional regulator [Nocardia puris]